jgi:hypothetical protein
MWRVSGSSHPGHASQVAAYPAMSKAWAAVSVRTTIATQSMSLVPPQPLRMGMGTEAISVIGATPLPADAAGTATNLATARIAVPVEDIAARAGDHRDRGEQNSYITPFHVRHPLRVRCLKPCEPPSGTPSV